MPKLIPNLSLCFRGLYYQRCIGTHPTDSVCWGLVDGTPALGAEEKAFAVGVGTG